MPHSTPSVVPPDPRRQRQQLIQALSHLLIAELTPKPDDAEPEKSANHAGNLSFPPAADPTPPSPGGPP